VGSHAADFGEPGALLANIQSVQAKIKHFIEDVSHEQIEGTYLGEEVLHYVDHGSRLWVCTLPDGELLAGFKLGPLQYDKLITEGKIK
jgi:hypothetical protein